VTITNWPDVEAGHGGHVSSLDAPLWPHDVPREGTRPLPICGSLYIDRDDFAEDPPKGFRRLVPGGAVRLRHGYVIRCDEVVKDAAGGVVELRCRFDPSTRSGDGPPDAALDAVPRPDDVDDAGWKPRGAIHWVSVPQAVPCEVRLYDRLFAAANPELVPTGDEEADFRMHLNPDSLEVLEEAWVEPWASKQEHEVRFQFERLGYFWRDPVDGRHGNLVFNRIVTLRDSWAQASASVRDVSAETSSGDARPDDAGGPPAPPELSPEHRGRAEALSAEFGIGLVDAAILTRDPDDEAFFRAAVAAWEGPVGADAGAGPLANWFIHTLPPLRAGRAVAELPFDAPGFARLVALVEEGVISSRGGSEVLEVMAREGGDPGELTRRLDLAQVSDDAALLPRVREVVEAHPDKADAYRGGKSGLLGFFMGQIMRATGGKADPERAKALLEAELGGG
jgi:glutaminyl-tRNA synthetase